LIYYILYNESKHNIVALVGKANKPAKLDDGQAEYNILHLVMANVSKENKTLCGIRIGEHRQEVLAKFGYSSKRKVGKFRIHLLYWRHFETYSCLNGDFREAA